LKKKQANFEMNKKLKIPKYSINTQKLRGKFEEQNESPQLGYSNNRQKFYFLNEKGGEKAEKQ